MYIDSPNISGSLTITGSLLLNGTAVTASGGSGTGAGFPFSGSAVITGSLYVSGGNISGSFVGNGAGLTGIPTASFALTASYAPNVSIDQFATYEDTFTNVPSHSAVHNFGTKNVFVQVFESDDTLLIPYSVTTTTANQVDIVFGDTLSGRVVIGKAGHILQDTGNFVSSSTAVATFTNATTASINHYLDSFNVITQVFDSNNNVIVPSNIKVSTKDKVDITFSTPRSGKAVIAKAGHIVSGTAAVSASYADTAVTASLATISERVQAGTSSSRDLTTPQSGSLWYNTNTGGLEIYNGVSGSGWSSVGGTLADTSPYTVEYLIVAGGGGTGYDVGGGGGAGGFLTGSFTVTPNITYTATVGGGGGSGQSSDTKGTNGDDSTITGTGLVTITAIGGGGGGTYPSQGTGKDGGSGGGGGYISSAGGAGTAGQGYDGGSSTTAYGSGGGGGAGGAGSNGSVGASVDGGPPITSTFTGTSVSYAGGGYGNSDGGAVYATGNNRSNVNVGTYGFGANGTGAPNASPYSGNGGIVILKIPSVKYTGETTGSPAEGITGDYTTLTFTSSGTYRA